MKQKRKEFTRVREQGTPVTTPELMPDPPAARIAALRQIVADKQYAKIDGIMVDLFSASAILSIYDNLNDTNKERYAKQPVYIMADMAFRLREKMKGGS